MSGLLLLSSSFSTATYQFSFNSQIHRKRRKSFLYHQVSTFDFCKRQLSWYVTNLAKNDGIRTYSK